MRRMSIETKLGVAIVGILALLAGCPTPLGIPTHATSVAAVSEIAPTLEGRVDFGRGQSTQAALEEVATAATVSLIDAATNVTYGTTTTNAKGRFSLNFGTSFRPSTSASYFLESVKGLSGGGSANRAGTAAARVRTLIYYRDGIWQSMTGTLAGSVVINPSTTAICLVASLAQGMGQTVNVAALRGSLQVGVPDDSVQPTTPDTFLPGASLITVNEMHQATALVEQALAVDADPMATIAMDAGPPRTFIRGAQAFDVRTVTPSPAGSYATVTFAGTNFDPTPANNVVRFNGIQAKSLTVSGDRTQLTVEVPRRSGISGTVSIQVGSLIKLGPSFVQNAWSDRFVDAIDLKVTRGVGSGGGTLSMTDPGSTRIIDTTNANFMAGTRSGPLQVINPDPVDGGDGALKIQMSALRVLQVYPDGGNKLAAAQGVFNHSPDLFNFDLLPVSVYKTLTALTDTFTVEQITKSGTVAPATAATGSAAVRTMNDYDLLYFGIADGYGGHDLTASSATLTRSFAGLGRGVLFTHDTVADTHPNFLSLSDIHGLAGQVVTFASANTVYQSTGINTASPILNRPFNLSGLATFSIQTSHPYRARAQAATTWYTYNQASGSLTPYWTTYTTPTSNAAFFSFGHTASVPAEYEAKAMINSMYYTFDRSTAVTGTFTSQPLDGGSNGFNWKDTRLGWLQSLPAGAVTSVQIQVAANDNSNGVYTYVGPDGTSGTYFTTTGATLPTITGRYLRYQAKLTTDSIAISPILSRVDFNGTAFGQSIAVSPNSLTLWGNATFTASTPAGTTVRVQVLDRSGVLIPEAALPGNSAGFTTSPINLAGLAPGTYPSLRLQGSLYAAPVNKPTFSQWGINWTP